MIIAIGLVASLFVVMLSFTIQRKNIVVISSLLATTTMVQYALLDKYSTMLLAAVTLLYGLVTLFEKRFPVLTTNHALPALVIAYSAVFFFVNGFQFNIELVAYLASLSGVVVMAINNQILVKWLMLVNGLAWVVYQISAGAYGQLPGEAFYTVGVVFSMVVLYRAKRSGMDLNKVPEFSTILKNKIYAIFGKNARATVSVPNVDENKSLNLVEDVVAKKESVFV